MNTAMSTTAPAPAPPTRSRRALEVVACSLLVTASAAIIALIVSLVSDSQWSITFVIARWLFVAALLVTPLMHQVAIRMGATWTMPYVLRTPATALLLTLESIAFDIASARLG